MGFTDFVMAVNRTTHPLEVTYNGRAWVLVPGYRRVPRLQDDGSPVLHTKGKQKGRPIVDIEPAGPTGEPATTTLPYFVAEAAKRQNPVMGTENPYGVDGKGLDYLVGVPEWGDDCSHREQSEAPERLDRSQLVDPRARDAEVIARRDRVPLSEVRPELPNPVGIQANYEG